MCSRISSFAMEIEQVRRRMLCRETVASLIFRSRIISEQFQQKRSYSCVNKAQSRTVHDNSVELHQPGNFKRLYSNKAILNMSRPTTGKVSLNEARRFMIDCFLKSNTTYENAEAMSDLLLEADYRGHFSHGMNRLEMYINDLHKNACDGKVKPQILKETPATAWVDGQNGLGAVVGNFCMDMAIEKAKNVGIGWVVAKRSNHYGIAGWYTLRAMNQGLIGISMTNTSPLMCPTRSLEPGLGTNPISFAAPGINDDSFLLDMATTSVAVGKIEMQRRKGKPIPHGWAQDAHGRITTDANEAFEASCLLPLGGSEITSGYKGYGLGAMVDICCGVLSGSNFATRIRKWTHAGADSEANLGQCFVAIDPNCFAPDFEGHLSEFNEILRNLAPIDPINPVLIAGDVEKEHMKNIDEIGGISYTENQIETNRLLAERLKIQPMSFT